MALRDLLFLQESSGPPTANRRRIRQARARMFPHHKGGARTRRTGSGPRADVQASPKGEEENGEEERKQEVGKEETSRGHSIRKKKTTTDVTTAQSVASTVSNITRLDLNTPDIATGDPGRSGLKTLRAATQPELVTGAPAPCATPPPPLGFHRSRTSVEPSNGAAPKSNATKSNMTKSNAARRQTTLRPAGDVIDVEAQSRLLQRIMLTVPPDVIAKATAHAHNLSDLMGYTRKREMLLLRERCHGERLGKADDRFTNLMAVLRK